MQLVATRFFPNDLYSGFPKKIIESLSEEDLRDLAVTVASLNLLYEKDEASWHNLTEEGFFFTNYGRDILRKSLSWIQGSIIVLDSQAEIIEIPAIDTPKTAIALPYITPADRDKPIADLKDRLTPDEFRKRLEEVVKNLPGLGAHTEETLDDLESLICDPEEWMSQPVEQQAHGTKTLVRHVVREANLILETFALIGSKKEHLRQAATHALSRIIGQFVLISHLKELRNRADERQMYASFLKATLPTDTPSTPGCLTKIERKHGLLYVEDPEITLMLLEEDLRPNPSGAGLAFEGESLDDVLLRLGLLAKRAEDETIVITQRAENVGKWLRFLLGENLPPKERERLDKQFELSDKDEHLCARWKWLDDVAREKSDLLLEKADQIRKDTGDPGAVHDVCEILFSQKNITREREFKPPVVLDIYRLLGKRGSLERNLVIFPVMPMRPTSRDGGRHRSAIIAAVFGEKPEHVGEEEPIDRPDQVRRLRSFATLVSQQTTVGVLEDKRREGDTQSRAEQWQDFSYVIGHDVKNRLDELGWQDSSDALSKLYAQHADLRWRDISRTLRECGKGYSADASREISEALECLDKHLADLPWREIASSLPLDMDAIHRAARCLLGVEALYGNSELFRVHRKMLDASSQHQLPSGWLGEGLRWPEDFRSEVHIPMIREGCRDIVLRIVHAHGLAGPDEFVLREVAEDGQGPRRALCIERTDYWHVSTLNMPPFAPRPAGGTIAMMAGLKEIVRNAVKCVLHPYHSKSILDEYGELHIDFSVRTSNETVVVELWNPFSGDTPGEGSSVKHIQRMYELTNGALSVAEPTVVHNYEFGVGGKPYAHSVFTYQPKHLRFEKT